MSHYDTLGVPKDASHEVIKRAYRQIALESHPDRMPGDDEATAQFRAATEAYAVLSDPEARRAYDRGYRPVESLNELLFSRPLGRKVLSAMLPSGPAAPRDGLDRVLVVSASTEIIEHGGIVEVQHPHEPTSTLTIRVEAGYRWCRITGLGEHGQRGGKNADLYIHLSPG